MRRAFEGTGIYYKEVEKVMINGRCGEIFRYTPMKNLCLMEKPVKMGGRVIKFSIRPFLLCHLVERQIFWAYRRKIAANAQKLGCKLNLW